jgi:hypothetical protein
MRFSPIEKSRASSQSKSDWLLVFGGLAIWWLFPLLYLLGNVGLELICPLALGLAIISFIVRRRPWGIVIWGPLMIISSMLLVWLICALCGLSVVMGEAAKSQNPASGILMLVILSALGLTLVIAIPVAISFGFGLASIPKNISWPVAALASINTFAVISSLWLIAHAASQEVVNLHLTAPDGHPVSHAVVEYMAYRPNGSGLDAQYSGTLVADDSGTVVIPFGNNFRKLEVETDATGFEMLKAELLSAHFSAQRTDSLIITSGTNPSATTSIPDKYPIEVTLHLNVLY